MSFDWSKTKAIRPFRDGPSPPREVVDKRKRFDLSDNPMAVRSEQGMSLMDFLFWCVPYDKDADMGMIGGLYRSLSDDRESPKSPAPR